ncbi:MAG TPA: zinc-finger domain-containing protein [Acidiphilium sp.]|nr:zinc-finger domain-containing protein [Acidiphilium sp.]HQU25041.1 zinc-finger domain-containing protein [Acidiphilium sp.]
MTVTNRTASCDGGDGPLGHPRIYLRIETDHVDCPYCTRRYRLAESAT